MRPATSGSASLAFTLSTPTTSPSVDRASRHGRLAQRHRFFDERQDHANPALTGTADAGAVVHFTVDGKRHRRHRHGQLERRLGIHAERLGGQQPHAS